MKSLLLGAWCLGLVLAALAVAWQRRGTGIITGRVVDPDGMPIHAGVWRYPMDRGLDGVGSEADGTFVLLLPEEPCELFAAHPDWADSESFSVPAGTKRVRGLTLRLRRPSEIHGRVLAPGATPVVGAKVDLVGGRLQASCPGWWDETDEQGRFVLQRGPVGGGMLFIATRERTLGARIDVQLGEGEVVELEIRLQPVPPGGELPELPSR